jgi:hypothetical protein
MQPAKLCTRRRRDKYRSGAATEKEYTMGEEIKNYDTTFCYDALRGLVLYPKMVLHFDVAREKSILALTRR